MAEPATACDWPATASARPFVVVLLMASECPADECTRCVMRVVGPLPDRAAAEAEARRWPAWTTPHLMPVDAPE